MSHPPYGGMSPAPAPWPPQGSPTPRPSRLPVIISTAIAVLAIVLAIAALLRSSPESKPEASQPIFAEQEISEAAAAMCEAWETTYASIRNVASKTTTDSNLNYVLILETQVVFHAAGDFIQTELHKNPATPAELREAFERLASSYHRIVLARLADTPEPEVEPIKVAMDSAGDFIKRECE